MKFRQRAPKAGARKSRGDPGAEPDGRLPAFRDGVAQDLANFFFHAPAVLVGALLEATIIAPITPPTQDPA